MALLVPSADAPAPVTSALKALLRCFLVWCLGAVWVVAGRQKTAFSLARVLAANREFRSRGNPAQIPVTFREFGVLVPDMAPWVVLMQSIGSVHSVLGATIIHGVLALNQAIKSVPGRWPSTGRPCQGAPYGWRYVNKE